MLRWVVALLVALTVQADEKPFEANLLIQYQTAILDALEWCDTAPCSLLAGVPAEERAALKVVFKKSQVQFTSYTVAVVHLELQWTDKSDFYFVTFELRNDETASIVSYRRAEELSDTFETCQEGQEGCVIVANVERLKKTFPDEDPEPTEAEDEFVDDDEEEEEGEVGKGPEHPRRRVVVRPLLKKKAEPKKVEKSEEPKTEGEALKEEEPKKEAPKQEEEGAKAGPKEEPLKEEDALKPEDVAEKPPSPEQPPSEPPPAEQEGSEEFLMETESGLVHRHHRPHRHRLSHLFDERAHSHAHRRHGRVDLPDEYKFGVSAWKECRIPVRNQWMCGSCWAHAMSRAFAERLCVQTRGKLRVRLSVEYLQHCVQDAPDSTVLNTCDGSDPPEALKRVAAGGADFGVYAEAWWKYDSVLPGGVPKNCVPKGPKLGDVDRTRIIPARIQELYEGWASTPYALPATLADKLDAYHAGKQVLPANNNPTVEYILSTLHDYKADGSECAKDYKGERLNMGKESTVAEFERQGREWQESDHDPKPAPAWKAVKDFYLGLRDNLNIALKAIDRADPRLTRAGASRALLEAIREEIYLNGPTTIDVTKLPNGQMHPDFHIPIVSDIMPENGGDMGHTLVLHGWKHTNTKDSWYIANSWGFAGGFGKVNRNAIAWSHNEKDPPTTPTAILTDGKFAGWDLAFALTGKKAKITWTAQMTHKKDYIAVFKKKTAVYTVDGENFARYSSKRASWKKVNAKKDAKTGSVEFSKLPAGSYRAKYFLAGSSIDYVASVDFVIP